MRANSVKDTIAHNFWDELFKHQRQQPATDEDQVKVVNLEKAVQGESRPAAHELPPAEDDNIVDDKCDGCLL